MTVAELLAASRAAHLDYRAALVAKDASAARAGLSSAATFRQQAYEANPERSDAAWTESEKTHPHDALMAFYAERLAR